MTQNIPTHRFVLSPKRAPQLRVSVAIQGNVIRVYSPRSSRARLYMPIRATSGRLTWQHCYTEPAEITHGVPHAP